MKSFQPIGGYLPFFSKQKSLWMDTFHTPQMPFGA
jgi:hypothetical protein